MTNYGHLIIDYKLPYTSDHSPMILHFYTTLIPIKIPFRFLNIWATHESLQSWFKDIDM